MKNILVTGGTGFIGRNLIVALSKRYNIFAVVRKTSDTSKIQKFCNIVSSTEIENLFKNHKIDLVIHLATNYKKVSGFEEYREMIKDNIQFGGEILHLMEKYECKKIINASTYFQHCDGTEKYSPANFYAATKQAFEDVLVYFSQKASFDVCSLALYDVYGPNDERRKFLNIFLEAIKNNQEEFNMTKGGQIVHFVHIDDIISAFEIAIDGLLDGTITGGKYYICDERNHKTLKEIVEILLNITDSKIKVNFGAMDYPREVVMIPFVGNDKLPQWKQKISVSQGLKLLSANI